MRIVFFGTPDFAVPSLRIIHENNYNIAGVVTTPDKPKGRGRNISVSPIKKYALENNLQLFTPQDLRSIDFETSLKELKPDLFVVVAFRILPENIFTIPPNGAFNLHGSLLPKYRGAAPIQWALIKGEKNTGLTTFFLKKKVDTGNIILQNEIEIKPTDNFGSLHDKMSESGSLLVLDTIKKIENGKVDIKLQDDSRATPAPKITKDTCKIDWNNSAENIHNLIRGLSPYPGAFFFHNNKQYKIFVSELTEMKHLEAGQIDQQKSEIYIGTQTNSLKILELQPEGRRRMSSEEFLRGYSLN
ncbi:MAG: methionyl-tRNA formyltransferase [Melioribacteraceae bacterium]|nr:methionyl-tRNA formyltransferase [Melioribacteraceae bacterium]